LRSRSGDFDLESDSDTSTSSSSTYLSLGASESFETVEPSDFRLLEKHIKPMEVDMEDGHVKSVRIEV